LKNKAIFKTPQITQRIVIKSFIVLIVIVVQIFHTTLCNDIQSIEKVLHTQARDIRTQKIQ
jgi:hypothetical protein